MPHPSFSDSAWTTSATGLTIEGRVGFEPAGTRAGNFAARNEHKDNGHMT
jgi:hypothetical protein